MNKSPQKKIFFRPGIIILTTILIIALIAIYLIIRFKRITKPDGSIPDQSTIENVNYENYWENLTGEDETALTEVKQDFEDTEQNYDNYIKICGGLTAFGSYLDSEDGTMIKTEDDLKKFLGTINTPEKAISYLYALYCYWDDNFKGKKQFVNLNDDGYLVSVIYYNPFGCGWHAHQRVNYQVFKDGSYNKVATIPLEIGERYCGD